MKLEAPRSGESILDYFRNKLLPQLNPLLGASGSGGLRISKSGANWIFGWAAAAAAEMTPWTPYVSPDAGTNGDGTPNPAAWRTVRIHGGKIDGVNPRSKGEDSLSDDTDLDDTGKAKAAEMDMELDASATTYVVAVQTRYLDTAAAVEANPEADPPIAASAAHNIGDIRATYLFFTTDTPPFPGWSATLGAEIPDIFRNAFFRTIAKIVTGSETNAEADDYHRLTIFQGPDADLTMGFVAPNYWEPIIAAEDPDNPGDDEWKQAKILKAGVVSGFPDLEINAALDLEPGRDNLVYADITLNQDTGAATAAEIATATTLPVANEPTPGQAPEFIIGLLATVSVPATLGKSTVALAQAGNGALFCSVYITGLDVNDGGGIVQLLSGAFWNQF